MIFVVALVLVAVLVLALAVYGAAVIVVQWNERQDRRERARRYPPIPRPATSGNPIGVTTLRTTYWCGTCGGHFEPPKIPISCCVQHSAGECCHYGDRRIDIEADA